MRIHPAIFTALPLLLLAMVACQPDTVCRQDSEIRCYLHCQDTIGTTIKDTSFVLRSDLQQMELILPFQDVEDTLSIHYQNDFRYISMACGNFVYHVLDSVGTRGNHNAMVRIDEPRVENFQKTHIVLTYINLK